MEKNRINYFDIICYYGAMPDFMEAATHTPILFM